MWEQWRLVSSFYSFKRVALLSKFLYSHSTLYKHRETRMYALTSRKRQELKRRNILNNSWRIRRFQLCISNRVIKLHIFLFYANWTMIESMNWKLINFNTKKVFHFATRKKKLLLYLPLFQRPANLYLAFVTCICNQIIVIHKKRSFPFEVTTFNK